MQFSLKDFAAEIARGTVAMAGVVYDIRALSGAELRLVQRTRARPTPPKKRPAGRGLEAEPEPDLTDGAYRQEMEAWHFYVQVVAAAIGLGHKTTDGEAWPGMGGAASDERRKAWAKLAYEEFSQRLSDQELGAIFSAVDALGLARLVGKAAGASSAPHPGPGSTTPTANSPSATASPSPALS